MPLHSARRLLFAAGMAALLCPLVVTGAPRSAHAAPTVDEAAHRVKDAESAHDAAETDVTKAQATLQRLHERREVLEEHLDRAAETLDEVLAAEARVAKLAPDDTSVRAVAREPLVTAVAVATDEAHARFEHAEQALEDARTAIVEAEALVETREARRHDAARALRRARSALDSAQLRSTWTAGQRGETGMLWPADGRAGSRYGYRVHPIQKTRRLHPGIDIPARTGAPIVAARDGTVIHAAARGGYGLTVVVDHGGGLATLYAHASVLEVAEGDEVEAGQRIARVGSTGQSTGPHLHFEVRLDDQPVDPMTHF